MWIILRNRQNHQFGTASAEKRSGLYQPGDIIALGDWPNGPGVKVEASDTMIAIEIKNRNTAQFKSWMKTTLVSKFGSVAESKFDEFFISNGKKKRGWMIDLPTVRAGLTANQRTWLKNNKNNISLTAAQFSSAFKSAIQRRPGSSEV